MRARDELVQRLATQRSEKLGGLSEGGFRELELDVRKNPQAFVDTPSDRAFYLVTRALERHEDACANEDLLDDDEYYASRTKRLARLTADCDEALAIDPDCLDAALIRLQASNLDSDRLLSALLDLSLSAQSQRVFDELQAKAPEGSLNAWTDLTVRPHLRLQAAVSRTALDTARYRLAAETGESCIALAPDDALGCRHTCALAYARLEDEESFDALDVRFSRQGSSWMHLARTILLYKLGRMGAAKRALEGYARLVEGGAYALLHPVMVELYLPDRPEAQPLSFEEATLVIAEADPIIMDVPDFIGWAQGTRSVWFAAEAFAERNGFDW